MGATGLAWAKGDFGRLNPDGAALYPGYAKAFGGKAPSIKGAAGVKARKSVVATRRVPKVTASSKPDLTAVADSSAP